MVVTLYTLPYMRPCNMQNPPRDKTSAHNATPHRTKRLTLSAGVRAFMQNLVRGPVLSRARSRKRAPHTTPRFSRFWGGDAGGWWGGWLPPGQENGGARARTPLKLRFAGIVCVFNMSVRASLCAR